METIELFRRQINALSNEDWNKLFNLIPEMEETGRFGDLVSGEEIVKDVFEAPYWKSSDFTQRFVKTTEKLRLVFSFDWMRWNEGNKMLSNKDQEYDSLDSVTLCMLLTTIIRSEKYTEGFLIGNLKNGTVLKILTALKNNQNTRSVEDNSQS